MLIVLRPDPIHHFAGFEHVLLTEQFFRLHVRRVGPDQFASETLAILLVHSAWLGIHAQQLAALIVFRFFCLGYRRKQSDSQNVVKSHYGSTPSGAHEIRPVLNIVQSSWPLLKIPLVTVRA